MAIYGWDVIPADVRMPKGEGSGSNLTTSSTPFSVPKGAVSMTIHTPTSFVGGGTVKIQGLEPASDVAAETWRDVQWVNLADGTFVALDQIPQNKVTTIPTAVTGHGVLRFEATTDQSSVPTTIKVLFD